MKSTKYLTHEKLLALCLTGQTQFDQIRFQDEITSLTAFHSLITSDPHVQKVAYTHIVENRYANHDALLLSADTRFFVEVKKRNKTHKEYFLDAPKVEGLAKRGKALHIVYLPHLEQLLVWDLHNYYEKKVVTMPRGPFDKQKGIKKSTVYVYRVADSQIIKNDRLQAI